MTPEQVDQLVEEVIEREGGYTNHPADRGGPTKYGISQARYPDLNIKAISRGQAAQLYKDDFVFANLIHLLDAERGRQVLDFVVHSGGAIRELQRLADVEVDGVMGPQTIQGLSKVSPKQILIARAFYLLRQTRHPFVVGWFHRLKELGLWQ